MVPSEQTDEDPAKEGKRRFPKPKAFSWGEPVVELAEVEEAVEGEVEGESIGSLGGKRKPVGS